VTLLAAVGCSSRRVLYGRLHVKAFDWTQPNDGAEGPANGYREAKLVTNRVVTSDDVPSILHATSGGNIHSFTALSHCAVLDVLAPPYAPCEGGMLTAIPHLLHFWLWNWLASQAAALQPGCAFGVRLWAALIHILHAYYILHIACMGLCVVWVQVGTAHITGSAQTVLRGATSPCWRCVVGWERVRAFASNEQVAWPLRACVCVL
jgi:PCO_ADO